MPTKFHSVLLLNLVILILGNAGVFLCFRNSDDMKLIMVSATFTTIHLFTAIIVAIYYRSLYDISPQGRGWFWSAIMISLLGLLYYMVLTLYN